MRIRKITVDTAQTLAAVTVASMLLLTAVAIASVGGPAGWAGAIVSGLVLWLSAVMLAAVRARDDAERRLASRGTAMQELARHADAAAAAMHAEIDRARGAVLVGTVVDPAAIGLRLDRADHAVDDVASVVGAVADHDAPREVVEVWRVVRRAMWGRDVDLAGEGTVFAHASRRPFETALRLIANSVGPDSSITVTVHGGDDVVKTTISVEDAGLDSGDAERLFAAEPPAPVESDSLGQLAFARQVARHAGGDLTYVRALGRSNYIVTMPAVTACPPEVPPPILTLTLPLDPVDGPSVVGGSRR